jgi:hypothetical protein
MAADALGRGRLDRIEVVLNQPVPRKAVRGGDRKVIALQRQRPTGA